MFVAIKEHHVGEQWVSSCGNVVTILAVVEGEEVTYRQEADSKVLTKDAFGFSCRYEPMEDSESEEDDNFCEDDGQPSMYEEYQDLWDGDDNFSGWAVEDY
jgi:hypothetical protein